MRYVYALTVEWGETMTKPVRVVHYLNQFFAGIGGEELANVAVRLIQGPVGPGRLLQTLLEK